MKTNQRIRMAADVLMVIFLPLLMAYSLVGEAVHEWLGIAMALLFLLHHALNWRWHRNITKGRFSAVRVLGTVMDSLLVIVMIALPVSGVLMSKHAFPFLGVSAGTSAARTVHLLASHWGFILMGLHLGLHWGMLLGMFKKAAPVKSPAPAFKVWLRGVAALLCLYGIYSLHVLQYGGYLFLKTQFVFLDFSKPILISLAERAAILCLFACAGHCLTVFLRKGVRHG